MGRVSPYESGELTDSIFIILLCMLQPVHGYKIMQRIQELTDGELQIGPATMYTTISKLCEVGWVEELASDGNRRQYVISEEGMAVLQKNFNFRKKIMALATELLTQYEEEK